MLQKMNENCALRNFFSSFMDYVTFLFMHR